MNRAWLLLVAAGTALAVAGGVHSCINARHLQRPRVAGAPDPAGPGPREKVHVLLPARDEADRIAATLASLDAQRGCDLRTTVLDDGSTDGTGDLLDSWGADRDRVTIIHGPDEDPPQEWLGKPWACERLSQNLADATVAVFLDADVTLQPEAVASAVALLRRSGADLVSPWPHQVAHSPLERLLQPLQQWSWLTTVPLPVAERSTRPSLAAANGQFLIVDAAVYRSVGGHSAVRGEVLEDIALARAFRRAGHRTVVADGSHVAQCRMYESASQVREGYRKSLWAAFGDSRTSPPLLGLRAAAVHGLLWLAYVVPPTAAVLGPDRATRVLGAAGYTAAVANRAVAARATGGRTWPDSLSQPLSIITLTAMTVSSFRALRSGRAQWKGRPVLAPH